MTVPATGVTNYFSGGTNLQEVLKTPVVNNDSGTVTLTWSSVEGGTYILLTKTNLISANWITSATVSAATNNILTTFTDAGAVLTNGSRFYRTDRTAVAPFTQ